jgi:hypothetical protein
MNSRTNSSEDVMIFLKVLERFESPEYERAMRQFQKLAAECPDFTTFRMRAPRGSEAFSDFDRVLCAYEVAGSLIKHNALNEDLFFDILPSVIRIWQSAQPWVNGLRKESGDQATFENVEWLAERMEEWRSQQQVMPVVTHHRPRRTAATAGNGRK